MNKQELLIYTASAGYDVGFGAKKHFATFDIIEKGPGWIGFVSLVGGIYALFVPFMAQTHVSAAFIMFGVISLYIAMYSSEKQRYEEAGKAFTQGFHDLHALYSTVKSLPDTADFTEYSQQVQTIRSNMLKRGLSKQIFLSDWYAHYKFFWQMQIDWIHEQRKFTFLRDKIPLSAYVFLAIAVPLGVFAYQGACTKTTPTASSQSATSTAPK